MRSLLGWKKKRKAASMASRVPLGVLLKVVAKGDWEYEGEDTQVERWV